MVEGQARMSTLMSDYRLRSGERVMAWRTSDGRYRVFVYTVDERLRTHLWLDSLEHLHARVAEAMSRIDPATEVWQYRN